MNNRSFKPENILIINPGSMFLQIGRATDEAPHTELHAIARKRYPGEKSRFDHVLPSCTQEAVKVQTFDTSCLQKHEILKSCIMSNGQKRSATSFQEIAEYNAQASPETIQATGPQIVPPGLSDVIVGNDVLQLEGNSEFNVHFPWKRGDFNVQKDIGGSVMGVLADLDFIWKSMIVEKLKIQLTELKDYRVVLVIPAAYNRSNISELVLLLMDMGFKSFFLLQDHVAATYSTGLLSACVIDFGHLKTSISCVYNGRSLRASRVRLPYGGGDITQCFVELLKKANFPHHIDSTNPFDAILTEDLKRQLCHMDVDVCGCRETSFAVKRPFNPVLKYTIQIGDECMLAPMGLFYPELFCLTLGESVSMQNRDAGNPSDSDDAEYLGEQKSHKAVPGEASVSSAGNASMDVTVVDVNAIGDVELKSSQPLSLDQAILRSVLKCRSDDQKRKMFSTILLVGGGAKFKGISAWIISKLSPGIPPHLAPKQIFITPSEDMDLDPAIATWKGAAMYARIETAQDLWITNEEIRKFGVEFLRGRCPFVW